MNAIARSLAVAAALSAAPALAHERHPAPPPLAPPVQVDPPYAGQHYPAPVPPWVAPIPAAPAPQLWGGAWAPRFGGEIRWLKKEYRRLERERERFYASWRGNPHVQRRFEAWYGARRAELDRRYEWLLARRDRRDHDGRFAWNGHGHHDD